MEIIGIRGVNHFHAGRHRLGHTIPEGFERVELITGGTGWFMGDGVLQKAVPGNILWHVAGDETLCRNDMSDPYRCLSVTFDLREKVQNPQEKRRYPRRSHWDELDRVRTFTREAVGAFVDPHIQQSTVLAYVLGRLSFQVEQWRQHFQSNDKVPEIRRVLEMIESKYHQQIDVKDLAAEAGWSLQHLHERFKEHIGTTPHQHLLERRIQAAREYLLSTEYAIAEIADRCGFQSASALCRSFKRVTSISPGKYRSRSMASRIY